MRPSHSLRLSIYLCLDLLSCVASSSVAIQPIEAIPAIFNPLLSRVPAANKHLHSRRIAGLLKFHGKKRAPSSCSAGQDDCDGDGTECCPIGTYCYFTGCCTRQQIGCAQQGCCPTGLQCCSNGNCCPMSYVCVPGGGCCPPGQSCTFPNNPPAIPGQQQPLRPQLPGQVASVPPSSTSKAVQVSNTKKSRSASATLTDDTSPSAPTSSAPADPTNSVDDTDSTTRASRSRSRSSSQASMSESAVTVLPNGETSYVYVTSTSVNPSASRAAPTAVSAAATPPIGPIIGTLVGIIIVILLIYWFVRRRLRNTEYDDNQPFWDVDDIPPSHGAQQMAYTDHGSQLDLIRRGESGVASDVRHQGSDIGRVDMVPHGRPAASAYGSDVSFDPVSPVTSYPPSSVHRSQSGGSRHPQDYGAALSGGYPRDRKQPVTLTVDGRSDQNPVDVHDTAISNAQPDHGVSLVQLTDMVSQLQSEVSRLHVVGGKGDPNYIPPPVYEHASPREI